MKKIEIFKNLCDLQRFEMIPKLLVFVAAFWLSKRCYSKGLFCKPLYTIVRYADVIFPKSVHISGAKLLFFLTQRWLPENQIINLSSFMFLPLITTPTSLASLQIFSNKLVGSLFIAMEQLSNV